MAFPAAPSRGSAVHHGNRQDAREGGETPPLPRNCERLCPVGRRIGSSDKGRSSARVVPPSAEGPEKPLETRRNGLVFGKVAGEGASQETGPRRFQPACVPRGTKEPP
jgi:hypothetical protein